MQDIQQREHLEAAEPAFSVEDGNYDKNIKLQMVFTVRLQH